MTNEQMKAILPKIEEKFNEIDHEVGDINDTENGWITNYFTFEEDGWCVDVTYECVGKWRYDQGDYWTPDYAELIKAWGRVTDIEASHYNEETGEESEITPEIFNAIKAIFEQALKSL